MAATGRTAHAGLQRLIIAREMNLVMGGAMIGPWDVDSLDDVTIDMVRGWLDLGDYKSGMKQVESVFAKWRAEHETYRK